MMPTLQQKISYRSLERYFKIVMNKVLQSSQTQKVFFLYNLAGSLSSLSPIVFTVSVSFSFSFSCTSFASWFLCSILSRRSFCISANTTLNSTAQISLLQSITAWSVSVTSVRTYTYKRKRNQRKLSLNPPSRKKMNVKLSTKASH